MAFSLCRPDIACPFPPTLRRTHPRRSLIGFIQTPCFRRKGPEPKNIQEAAKLLRPLFEETVRDHLIADVPLGVFLSSGLDSTALVALASRTQSDLHTFTVIFPEQRYSEAKISGETAKRFKTQHQEILFSPSTLVEQLEDAVKSLISRPWMG